MKNTKISFSDTTEFAKDSERILELLSKPCHFILARSDLQDAALVRKDDNHGALASVFSTRREIVEILYARGWLAMVQSGKMNRYEISPTGRMVYERQNSGDNQIIAPKLGVTTNIDNAKHSFETPVQILSRKMDKNGIRYLTPRLIAASELLREDYEIAEIAPQVTSQWASFIERYGKNAQSLDLNSSRDAARNRWAVAMEELGAGLADITFLVCCRQEGLETAEKLLGWPARSAKIVLRIALIRLADNYEIPEAKFVHD